ncbi:hypothetical protein IFM89_030351 [Coptis chinensis]|uniref:Uncharacterized protein n=1 Tax=Coptis chinensis TaxID=261450 RepID=A0A835M7H5_9MAGN|nr:hypothetical protein IFM89_030351 [Coptis chinensis]
MQKTSKGATMKEPKRKKCLTIVKYSPSTVRWRAEVVSIETHPEYPLAFHNVKNYGDAMLTRFLVARLMNPMKAVKMLVSWKKWREEFVPLGFIPDSEGPD